MKEEYLHKLLDGFGDYFSVEPNTGCWLWSRAHDSRGYGFIAIGYKTMRAHRVMWEIANRRKIPAGMIIMHTCDQTCCVNPMHLKLATEIENKYDSMRKNRHPHGKTHGRSIVTKEMAIEIKEWHKLNFNLKTISLKFGVSEPIIRKVIAGIHWTMKD